MDGIHPNRKKDKLNPYTLSIENSIAFNGFELDDISLMNEASRHLTEADAGDEPLGHRIADPSEPVEDYVYRRIMYQELHKAIAQLSEIQRRRIQLYYFKGYTYEQIAQIEECTHPAIVKSIKAAERNIFTLLRKSVL